MPSGEVVEIVGLSARGKNRVREHGPTFRVVKRGRWAGEPAMQVECLREGCAWWGWLTEAEAANA